MVSIVTVLVLIYLITQPAGGPALRRPGPADPLWLSIPASGARSGASCTAPKFVVAAALILLILLVAAFPGAVHRRRPQLCRSRARACSRPSAAHWFGTDLQGHDIYARTIYGARASVAVGLGATLAVFVVGGALGALAGFYGGWVDALVSRITDVFFGLPLLLAAIVLMQVMHHRTVWTVIAILALFGWPQVARIARSSVLEVRGSDYVLAAKALGLSRFQILLRHALPNAIGPVIAVATIALGCLHRHRGHAVLPRGRAADLGGVLGRRHQRRADAAAGRFADPVLSRWRTGDYGAGLHDDGRCAARRPGSGVTGVAGMTAPRSRRCCDGRGPGGQVRHRRARGARCGSDRPARSDRRRGRRIRIGEVHDGRRDPRAAAAGRANHRPGASFSTGATSPGPIARPIRGCCGRSGAARSATCPRTR